MEQMKVPSMIETKVTNSLKGSVLDLIQRDYQFIAGDKIQEMFASDLVEVVRKSYREPWKLEVGQILWYGVKVSEKPNYGKNSKKTPLTPIVLTLISKEDLEMKKAAYSDREIMETKIARIFKEAYEQGALLTHSDIAYLLHVSTGTVSKQTKAYMERTGEILPTRGIIQDIGRAITHKRIILKLYRKGYQTPEIARMTNHTEEACGRYIKAYKKVEKLNKTMKSEEIAQILGMGISLVEEYIRILNEEE
jgi:predicted transcriptional regulator